MRYLLVLLLPLLLSASHISVQVLGSGGPETSKRASAAYLVKKDGKALVVIDFGAGALLRFSEAKAKIEDLELVLFTHLHIDHVVEFPALMKAGYFSKRKTLLPIIGPAGNTYFPGLEEYIDLLFGEKGAYRYMSDILTMQSDSFSIHPIEIKNGQNHDFNGIHLSAVPVNHGVVPAFAYRIEIEGIKIVFSGDTSARSDALSKLAEEADLFIAHHAIPEKGFQGARELHMTPSRIANIAHKAKVKKLVLSHRMKRTFGLEAQHESIIRKYYRGPLVWAEDLMEIVIKE